jgi:two-component system response regulator YesN
MLKVLLVDDEAKTRRGIRTMMKWEEHNLELIGEAINGVQALEIVKNEKPDLVIADIRMPLMNGIDFARSALVEQPGMKVIFLTGYDDFEYAKEAVKLHASDYLLKPFGLDELTEVICRIRDQVKQENDKKHHNITNRKIINANLFIVRQQLLRKDFYLNENRKTVTSVAENLGISINKGPYRVIAYEIDNIEGSSIREQSHLNMQTEKKIIQIPEMKLILSQMEYFARDAHAGYIIAGNEKRFFLLQTGNSFSLENSTKKIQTQLQHVFGISVSIGIGNEYADLTEIPNSLHDALHALFLKPYRGKGSINRFTDLQEISPDIINHPSIEIERKIYTAIRHSDITEAEQLVKQAFQDVQNTGYHIKLLRSFSQRILDLVCFRFVEEIVPYSSYGSDLDNAYLQLAELETLAEMEALVIHHMHTSIERWNRNTNNLESPVVRCTMDYIKNNYSQELSLKKISNMVSVSPNYLCRIFKQETGMTLKQWHHLCRIEQAKELLHDSRTRTCEAADRTGFNDYKYFSRIFKRITGMTPLQYKKTHAVY